MFAVLLQIFIILIVVGVAVSFLGAVGLEIGLDFSGQFMGLAEILHVVYYILPIGKLTPIIVTIVAILGFRIVISIVKTIWALLPIV